MIRNAVPEDAAAICDIYNHYVLNTIITFETQAITPAAMADRIRAVLAQYEWIVWQDPAGTVIGYAYFNAFRPRAAYWPAVESTVYVKPGLTRQGIGQKLYEELLERFRRSKYHSMMACLALPNEPSVRLHEKFGFVKVAHMKEAGFKLDRWVDVGYWQLMK